MILLCERNEVVGFCLLQHTQRPNHICLQKGLQACECILHNRVNLYRKMSIRDVVGGAGLHEQTHRPEHHQDIPCCRTLVLCWAGSSIWQKSWAGYISEEYCSSDCLLCSAGERKRKRMMIRTLFQFNKKHSSKFTDVTVCNWPQQRPRREECGAIWGSPAI